VSAVTAEPIEEASAPAAEVDGGDASAEKAEDAMAEQGDKAAEADAAAANPDEPAS